MMYDRFSDKGAHSAEWFDVAKNFLKITFTDDRREAKCPYNRCQNRRILSEYDDVCDIRTVYDISCIFCLFLNRQW
jgi:hypothetical protein